MASRQTKTQIPVGRAELIRDLVAAQAWRRAELAFWGRALSRLPHPSYAAMATDKVAQLEVELADGYERLQSLLERATVAGMISLHP